MAVRFGIYADKGFCFPGRLIEDGGTIDATTTGVNEVTVSAGVGAGSSVARSGVAGGGNPRMRCCNENQPMIGRTTANTSVASGFGQTTVSCALPATHSTTVSVIEFALLVWLRTQQPLT